MSHVAALGKPYSSLIFQHAGRTAAVYSDGDEWKLIDYLLTNAANNVTVINTALALGGEVNMSRGTYLL
ncbi:unnamed protein product, partial [marine sediment metagenome]